MAQLIFLDSARHDLVHILRYVTTQSASLQTGQDFVAALRLKCRHLAGLPGTMGRPRPELREDMRSFAFRGYVIFFRYVGDRLEVVNILEGHRDIDAYFDDTE
ncbi:plasmid stabilization system protein ParE [Rhizobium aquaticum]|uniref:Plasmid stabilization system protein ParE n=1 Tax=Rhizobium aquaticum TaxID=1549636 RepID=A0ABV2J4Q1_9HYPH